MSLYGALFAGVSGLAAQSSAMGAISDNVTNVNTIGYKGSKVNFQTLVTKQVSSTAYSAGGVQSRPRAGVDVQGLLQATTSSTDVGISGSGFFIVSEQATSPVGYAYSRAGSFKVDKDGYLQNVGGSYLQGWPLDNWDGTATASTVTKDGSIYMKSYKNAAGETYYMNDNAVDSINLQPLNLTNIGGTARATSTLGIAANLPSGALVGATEKTNALIYDSLGNAHNLNYTWSKRAANSWDYEVMPPAGSTYVALDDQTSARQTSFAAGRLDFNSVPQAGTNMSLTLGGQSYTFNFVNTDDSNNNFLQNGGTNASTVGSTGAAGDTVVIGGVTFTLVSGAASNTTEIDITGVTTAADLASRVSQTAESYFDTRLGAGNWVKASGATIQSSLPLTAVTGTTFGAPATDATINDNGTNTPGARVFNINVTAKSLSQVLDQLGAQISTAFAFESINGGYGLPPSPPSNLGGRVAGENAIWFRQFSSNSSQGIQVNASGLTNVNGAKSVQQNAIYTVPPLSSNVAWNRTSATGNNTLKFNGDGTIDKIHGYDETSANDPRLRVRIGWSNGALNMDGSTVTSGGSPAISLFLGNYNSTAGGMQQKAGDYQLTSLTQNGNKFGNFAGVTIGEDGIVIARFDNGVTTPIFMIPVATFVNPNGMSSSTGNVFNQTSLSGLPTVREAGSGGSGKIAGGSLESSTVDLGEEFTNMITTQRAYSAAAKIITTSDQMLEELVNIKR